MVKKKKIAEDVFVRPDVVASVDEGMVRLGFGEHVESEFRERDSLLIDPDEAIALADVLPDIARAALNNRDLG